ncbi:MAG: HK97 family phage prohead protease [Methanomassiliicoccales archaeon]|jgi:hypothetical protein
METKTFKCEFKAKGNGEVYGVANAYGILDLNGEVVDPGACKRSLDTKGPIRKMLYQHSTFHPIGLAACSEGPQELRFDGKITQKTKVGQETYALIEDGIIDQTSIGYDVIHDLWVDNVRHLSEIRLWEVSPVTFAANELAIIEGVKGYGYGSNDLALILEGLKALSDPVSEIISRHQAGKLTLKDREDAVKASSILQELIGQKQSAGGPGDHPPASAKSGDPSAGDLSDPEVHSLLEAAREIRASVIGGP